jgi:hypothetical protein
LTGICSLPEQEKTMTTNNNEPSGAKRCYNLMDRIIDVAQQEFIDLSPAEIVFALGLLQWRYYDQIDGIARGRYQVPEEPKAPPPAAVN